MTKEEQEIQLNMLIIGKNALNTAIKALKIDYDVSNLENLKETVNKKIELLKESSKQ